MALADSTITVDVHDTLPDVLTRLQTHAGRTVRLRVPTGSAVLLTANEFRVLKDAADRDRVQLTLESPDRLRLQLARMFSLPAAFPDPAVVTPIRPDVTPHSPPPNVPRSNRPDSNKPANVRPPVVKQRELPPRRARSADSGHAPTLPPSQPPATGERRISRVQEGEANRSPDARGLHRREGREGAAHASGERADRAPIDAKVQTASAQEPKGANDELPAVNANGTSKTEHKTEAGQTAAELVGGDVPKEILLLAASDAIPERRAKRRRIEPPRASAVSNHHHVGTIDVDDLSDGDTHWTVPAAKQRFGRGAAIGAGVAVLVVLALIFGAVFALPGVTVAVTLKQQPIQGDVTYRVITGQPSNPPASGSDLVFPATPFAFDVTVTKQMPTTGTRLIPQETASGSVTFANPTKQSVNLAKGTRLTAETGIPFQLTEDVSVPAADAKTGHSGFANGKVRAVDAGSSGNLEAGVLGGHLDVGVYYSNRDGPTTGGTDKKMPAVSGADLKTLQSRVEPGLPQTARDAVGGKLPAGQSLVPSSLTLGQPTYSFDHKEGEQARQLSLTASVHVTGLSYDQAAATERVKETLQEQLAGGVPAGYTLDSGKLQLSQPAETAHDANGSQFKITASGHAHAIFSASARRHLADQLSGKSAAEAAKILAANPALTGAEISYSPSWLPKRMPRLSSRIDIHVAS